MLLYHIDQRGCNMSNYNSQIKHLRENYKSFHIDFKKQDFDTFRTICVLNNTTPTTVIKQSVRQYCLMNKPKA